ncbi:hypothetical protein D3C73_1469180 [compost metagenome]
MLGAEGYQPACGNQPFKNPQEKRQRSNAYTGIDDLMRTKHLPAQQEQREVQQQCSQEDGNVKSIV